jgi:BASS family bile acid:Na+ symporter
MTAHVLLTSLMATVTIPICATLLIPADTDVGSAFWSNALCILSRVSAVLVLPLILGWSVRYVFPPLHRWAVRHSNLPFYLWSIALAITSGVTIRGIDHARPASPTLSAMAACSLFICLAQFAIGRRIGLLSATRKKGTPPASVATASSAEGGQALGQKNTALIIWATTVFFHPAAALAPGCYVLWQNIINSLQLHRHSRNKSRIR